jgi:hypothetical protein
METVLAQPVLLKLSVIPADAAHPLDDPVIPKAKVPSSQVAFSPAHSSAEAGRE